MTLRRLEASDRDFFRLVSEAAFANPFGAARYELDAAITGVPPDDPEIVDRLVSRVAERLRGCGRPGLYPADEGELIEQALLFDAFHRYAAPFDEFLAAQREAEGDESLSPPFLSELRADLVRRGIARRRVDRFIELFHQLRRAFVFISEGLVGTSSSIRTLRTALWNNIFTSDARRYERHLWNRLEDFSTILLGETGTGKGAAAAAIGRSGFIPLRGDRFAESFATTFVPVNLSELPQTLLESELFGHRRGAFTGAVDSYDGVFARSGRHGTIFLDEVGDLAPHAQVKLLRVLQDRSFTPLGSHAALRFEGRVIAATHRSLSELRRAGEFRDDLYYRLCSDVIEVPALRQRLREDPSELLVLLETLVARIAGRPAPPLVAFVQEAIVRDIPADYAWPGNVRELEQCVRRVLLTGRSAPDPTSREESGAGFWQRAQRGSLDAAALVAGYCALLHEEKGTFEAVAQITGLDRRTVKKRVLEGGGVLEP